MSNLQLNKLKSGIKDNTEATLKISPNVIGDSNDENNFPHKLLLTKAQVSSLSEAFSNNSSAKIIKNFHKIEQSGGFLGRLLGPLLKTRLPLIGSVLKSLAKSLLVPLGLTAAATDASIPKKMFGSGFTTLIISNEEMNGIVKIVKSLEESGLLIKGVSETIKNESKEQKRGFSSMLLGTLGASLLGNLLRGKGAIATSQGRETIRAGEGKIRASENF